MAFRVLLVGGYGNFGARIARRLAFDPSFHLIVAGRNPARADALCGQLRSAGAVATLQPQEIDLDREEWKLALDALRPQLLIHACGPFQGQDYSVAEAVTARGIHYVDLADGRAFVLDFAERLSGLAQEHDVLAVTGASTLPGLSAAVVDHLRLAFHRIDTIDCGISPGNQSAPGAATVAAILGYVGRPFAQWHAGEWRRAFGWQQLHLHRFQAPIGARWLSACDVPDLSLFPPRYGAAEVRFGAGLELPLLHMGLWAMSWLSRARLVDDWSRYTPQLLRIFRAFASRGSDVGGMHVTVRGIGHAGERLCRVWTLIAEGGDGPQVPCTPAVLLARKLASGTLAQRGAQPCLDLFTHDEFMTGLAGFRLRSCVRSEVPAEIDEAARPM